MSAAVLDARITADNPGYENAGMVTVDLALESVRKQRLGRHAGVEWFTRVGGSLVARQPGRSPSLP